MTSPPTEDDRWSACKGARVLIVDDDVDMRELLAARLERAGCAPTALGSGSDALARLRSAAEADAVDLLLVDLRMPGVTGIEVLRDLVGERRHIPAILMTGYADAGVIAEALALGVHVLEKPFSFDELRRVAAALLVSHRIERRRDSERIRLPSWRAGRAVR